MTTKQRDLAKRKLCWTLGFLTDDERRFIESSCDALRFERGDASNLIEDLFDMTIPISLPQEEAQRDIAIKDIKNLLKKYGYT